jgi:hypothetical protein
MKKLFPAFLLFVFATVVITSCTNNAPVEPPSTTLKLQPFWDTTTIPLTIADADNVYHNGDVVTLGITEHGLTFIERQPVSFLDSAGNSVKVKYRNPDELRSEYWDADHWKQAVILEGGKPAKVAKQ